MENLNMMAFTAASYSPQTQQNNQLLKRREECGVRGSCRIKKCRQHLLIYYMIPILVIFCWLPDFIVALKDVSVTIPQAVKRGSNAMLTCNYDMENDTLYSVKWYKGRREFYRYTPKENPAMKVFPSQSGLNVERNLSNQSHVVLLAVPLNISGKFTCEISVEAPSFQTAMVSGEMEIVELPEEQATVTGIQPRYRIGDLVDGNCSIKYSKPAANLTWTINGIVVPPHHIKTYQIEKYEENNLESVMSAVHFMVTTQHFIKGQMRLKCTASIFDIFKEEIESVIEEDRPRIMASGQSYPTDHGYGTHGDADGYEHNESYLTYFSAPKSSASPTADFVVSKVIKFLKQTFINNFQLLKSLIATKTKNILTMTIVNNLKGFLAPNDFIKIKITHYNALQHIMIRFMTTSLVILLVRVIWQKIQQNLLIKCLRNKLTQDKQLAHNCIEVLRQMEIFLAINLWRKTQYSNEKEQQEENENCYQNANDNDCQTKCGQRKLQQSQQEKSCSVSNRNVFNKIASLNDTNIVIISKNTNNKNSAAIKATIDCQHHMSQTLAFSSLPPSSSCALIHLPSSSSFTSSSLRSSTLTSKSISTSTSSSLLLPFSSVESKNRKTHAHDSFPLYAVDASKSNNAKYMSKDQTLLMTLTATAANSIVVVFVVFGALATSNSLYETPSAFVPITATLLRALVLEPKLLQTSVHSSLASGDEQSSLLPSPISFRNNYLMAFIGELLLHQC